MPALLPPLAFAHIFEPLRGQTIGIVDCPGNAGDRMIHAATRQLCATFDVRWRTFVPWSDPADGLDSLLLFGGGNLGSRHQCGPAIRRAAFATGLPCDCLPQSWQRPEDWPWRRCFARERDSLALAPAAILAPDLALGWDGPQLNVTPRWKRGLCLRRDGERSPLIPRRGRDPIRRAWLPADYVALAAQFEEIITDRLHFAIAGLLAGRLVHLLPGSYHKNRSMYETWLADLGCGWNFRTKPTGPATIQPTPTAQVAPA